MKRILIIAGPNGAGKTTFATEFLPNEAGCPEFVNADLIAAGLSPFQPDQVAFVAGRLMLQRIADLVAAGTSFAFETTLSTRSWLRLIPQWKSLGYRVKLYFLKLPDADLAIRRVRYRVQLGGHAIPEVVIRRRFARGWENFENGYRSVVDEWAVYDAQQLPVRLIEAGDNCSTNRLMEDAPEYQREKVKPLDDPDLIGAQAAFDRAAAKVLAQAKAAGLEPIVSHPDDLPKQT